MSETDKMSALRTQALALESQAGHLFADLRTAIAEAEAEAQELRAAAERFNLEVFTEKEAAERLRVSDDTMARLRVRLGLPHFRVGSQYRYTSAHLVEIIGILEKRKDAKQARRHLREVSASR
jgi:excisionase family DNA binding protein